jgi:tRNA A37 methylthiotransferase MiaB
MTKKSAINQGIRGLRIRPGEIILQKNEVLEGRVEKVLVEGQSKQGEGDVTGRTRTNKIVNFEGE